MDDALKVQFPLMEGLLEAMSIPVVRVAGWEGDDILAPYPRATRRSGTLATATRNSIASLLPASMR